MNEYVLKYLEALDDFQINKLKADGCKYNCLVQCPPDGERRCSSCGWNPRIRECRIGKIRKELAKENVY